MNLKTFLAKDMPTALAEVRQALGADAVILHTRTVKRGGWMGFFPKTFVEVTAADKELVAKYRRKKQAGRTSAGEPARVEREQGSETRSQPAWSGLAQRKTEVRPEPTHAAAGDLIRKTYAAALSEIKQQGQAAPSGRDPMPQPLVALSAAPRAAAAPAATPGARPAPTPQPVLPKAIRQSAAPLAATPVVMPIGGAPDQLTQEMRSVQRMVGKMLRRQKRSAAEGAPADLSEPLFDQYLTMMKQEVTEEIAEEVLSDVQKKLAGDALRNPVLVKAAVLEAVARMIPVDPEPVQVTPSRDGRPLVMALIGPTGVGKTTTVAKLAANLKLRQNRRVGLITLDTYRIAAVEQLRTYAQIIGVPLEVASTPGEVSQAMVRCRERACEVVLIDTAGRSQRDDPKLEQLAALLQAAEPHQVHLVLSSVATQSVLEQAAERFARLRADRIIFTKIDEAVSFGVLLNVARRINKRLSFVTTGQEVPHDIEPGRAQRLAALVLGEGA